MKKHVILFVCCALLMMGCGTSRSSIKVSNNAEGTETTISVSGVAGGSTSVQVTPDVKVDVKLGNEPSL